jgi:hypothetical protein
MIKSNAGEVAVFLVVVPLLGAMSIFFGVAGNPVAAAGTVFFAILGLMVFIGGLVEAGDR